ncbi:hypothetical protein VTN31DRAFT_893 [Thermomyces dupontii]|uniref:uncharacterized protein n=1 Tax=Talaromyces thermophilus TaxID=28565 RepID=UPI0037426E50
MLLRMTSLARLRLSNRFAAGSLRPSQWTTTTTRTSPHQLQTANPSAPLHQLRQQRWTSSQLRPPTLRSNTRSSSQSSLSWRRYFSSNQQSQQPTSLSARLKTLSREYGWSALGVYLALSALDFPFCFAAVRVLGVERIGHAERVVVDTVKGLLKRLFPFGATQESHGEGGVEGGEAGGLAARFDDDHHGVLEATKANEGEGASIWTQLALAYAIHKSFIFIRVPLTAAITPKVVKTLRRWGWDIGKRQRS